MRLRYAPFYTALLVLLTACTILGYEPPQSLPDRIAYVTSGADSVVLATTNALNAHVISSADAQFVSTTGKQLSALTAAASTDPDPKSAEGRLKLAEDILKRLQVYLASKQVKS